MNSFLEVDPLITDNIIKHRIIHINYYLYLNGQIENHLKSHVMYKLMHIKFI
jgi:hypothetical protein